MSFRDATVAWALAAHEVLLETAQDYGHFVTMNELAARVQEMSGVRTDAPTRTWVDAVLRKVARRCRSADEPPLTALCVRQNHTVTDSYKYVLELAALPIPDDLELHAAYARWQCYHTYGTDVPAGIPPLTPKVAARRGDLGCEGRDSGGDVGAVGVVALPAGVGGVQFQVVGDREGGQLQDVFVTVGDRVVLAHAQRGQRRLVGGAAAAGDLAQHRVHPGAGGRVGAHAGHLLHPRGQFVHRHEMPVVLGGFEQYLVRGQRPRHGGVTEGHRFSVVGSPGPRSRRHSIPHSPSTVSNGSGHAPILFPHKRIPRHTYSRSGRVEMPKARFPFREAGLRHFHPPAPGIRVSGNTFVREEYWRVTRSIRYRGRAMRDAVTTTSGAWRTDDGEAVSFRDATVAWALAAHEVLLETAQDYGHFVTMNELAARVQEMSGVRTDAPTRTWVDAVLRKVARRCRSADEPPLTALCVRQNHTVTDSYKYVLELAALGAVTVPLAFANGPVLLGVAGLIAGLFCAPTIAASVSRLSHIVPEGGRGDLGAGGLRAHPRRGRPHRRCSQNLPVRPHLVQRDTGIHGRATDLSHESAGTTATAMDCRSRRRRWRGAGRSIRRTRGHPRTCPGPRVRRMLRPAPRQRRLRLLQSIAVAVVPADSWDKSVARPCIPVSR
ncbi:hypothetical protein [Nocardia terpenica]|uniref:hypothetical protein n=1 Tax=Nocardia terpenica TaxID=455432 RepID=UPI000AB543EC|nr:hypothetical protein [Nocardia terpenica]